MKFTLQTGETNAILRNISEPIRIDEFPKYKKLAEEMVKYIKNPDNRGVGLAAPQIGVNKRLIVVSLMRTYEDENYKTIPLFNPEIIEHADETCQDTEGCLSVPGESGEVERYTWIKLRYQDIQGKIIFLRLQDLAARIVQHEIDHLNGVLFTDRVIED